MLHQTSNRAKRARTARTLENCCNSERCSKQKKCQNSSNKCVILRCHVLGTFSASHLLHARLSVKCQDDTLTTHEQLPCWLWALRASRNRHYYDLGKYARPNCRLFGTQSLYFMELPIDPMLPKKHERWNFSRNGAYYYKCVPRHLVPLLPKQIQINNKGTLWQWRGASL